MGGGAVALKWIVEDGLGRNKIGFGKGELMNPDPGKG